MARLAIGTLHRRAVVATAGIGTLGVLAGSPVLLGSGLFTLGVIGVASQSLHIRSRSTLRRGLVHGLTIAALLATVALAKEIRIDAAFVVLLLGLQNRLLLRASTRDDLLIVGAVAVLISAASLITSGLNFLLIFAALIPAVVVLLWTTVMLASAEGSEGEYLRMVQRPCPPGAARLGLLAVALTAVGFSTSMLLPRYRFAPFLSAGAFANLPGATRNMNIDFGAPSAEDLTVVLRVESEDQRESALSGLYARVFALSHFDGKTWSSGAEPSRLFRGAPLPGDLLKAAPKLKVWMGRLTRTDTHPVALLGRTGPWAVEGKRILFEVGGTAVVDPQGRDLEYVSTAELALPEPQLTKEFKANAEREERALPEGLDPRVTELAASLTADQPTEAGKIRAVLAHFARGFTYSRERVDTGGEDPLTFFLFSAKTGHCELYAGAAAVLLRAAGLRTRVATGYYLGRYNSFGGYLSFRQSDAHAWVEVYTKERGWTWIDATPEAERHLKEEGLLRSIRDGWEALNGLWFNNVVDYDARRQERTYEAFARAVEHWWSGGDRSAPVRSLASSARTAGLGWVLLGIAFLALSWAAYVRFVRVDVEAVGALLRQRLGAQGDAASVPLGRLLMGFRGDRAQATRLVAEYERLRFSGSERPSRRDLTALSRAIRSLGQT
ncbi:MAG: transglutaminaseTgpA domain-containing protein [Myxococcota bacterium]